MKVVVLYNHPALDASPDEQDVLVQRNAIVDAICSAGHQVQLMECSLDLETIRQQLLIHQPDVVFNLVETLGGTDRLAPLVCMLMDALDISYTGNQSDAMLLTCNKLVSKKRILEAGLPTPAWRYHDGGKTRRPVPRPRVFNPPGRRNVCWILKPVLEHASFGLDDHSVVIANRPGRLNELLELREQQLGRPHFAEQFINGREFNLSLLDAQVLPPAEIQFIDFPPGKPQIVGHAAKWQRESWEYQQTVRRFNFPSTDRKLLRELRRLAQRCWELFDLTGYARVDFRVDAGGQPWILEVNTNPCLSPDAGFAAAVAAVGLTHAAAIQKIVAVAAARRLQVFPDRKFASAIGLETMKPFANSPTVTL